MSQSGFTPVLIYASGTTGNSPSAANLTSSSQGAELALNYFDGKLFYKDASGNVQVLATKGTGPIGGSNTQIQYNSSGALAGSANLTFDGTNLAIGGSPVSSKGQLQVGTIGYTDTGVLAGFASSVAGYNQVILQNTNSGATASTNFNVSNDQGSATTNYGEFGINSSGFSGSGFSTAGWTYLASASTDLAIGTYGSNAIHFIVNSGTTDAMTISSAGAVSLPGGTANGIAYLNGSKVLTTGSALTFDGTNLGIGTSSPAYKLDVSGGIRSTLDASIHGLTVGQGSGSVSSNTAVGNSALVSNTTGANNTATGYQAGYSSATSNGNVFNGYQSGYTSTGAQNTFVGSIAGYYNAAGAGNTAVGNSAYASGGTTAGGNYNTAIGASALQANTTGSNSTAVGYQAGYGNTTGGVDAFGYQALSFNSTGVNNAAFGQLALYANTTGVSNTAVGAGSSTNSNRGALGYNTTGSYNTAFGTFALLNNTTASNNTAVGYQALFSQTTPAYGNQAFGYQAGYSITTGVANTLIGNLAGYGVTTGSGNTMVGPGNWASGNAVGQLMTTGSNNTLLGGFNGNQNSLDIRTSSGNLVLSSGAGTPLVWYVGGGIYNANNTTTWNTTSDARVKKNVVPLAKGLDVINALNPVEFDYIIGGKHDVAFLAQEYEKVLPEQVSETTDITDEIKALTNGEPLKQLQQNLVPYLVKAVQELSAQVAQLQSQLKGN